MVFIQSILIDKDWYTKSAAEAWVKRNGYIVKFKGKNGPHSTENFWRFRQAIPQKDRKYFMKYIAPGVKFIFQY